MRADAARRTAALWPAVSVFGADWKGLDMAETMNMPVDTRQGAVGKPIDRVDGRLKVTGQARYAAEGPVSNVAHGVIVSSTVGSGRISGIDSSTAEAVPGVICVGTSKNMPRLQDANKKGGGCLGESRLPLSGGNSLSAGQ